MKKPKPTPMDKLLRFLLRTLYVCVQHSSRHHHKKPFFGSALVNLFRRSACLAMHLVFSISFPCFSLLGSKSSIQLCLSISLRERLLKRLLTACMGDTGLTTGDPSRNLICRRIQRESPSRWVLSELSRMLARFFESMSQ